MTAAKADAQGTGLRIGLVHTVASLTGTFADLLADEAPGASVVHVADPDLLATAISTGVTDAVRDRVAAHARHLADAGAAVVMVTCSSIAEAAEVADTTSTVPVLRVDAPMAAQAVALATAPGARGRIAVLATLSSTLGPTGRLVQREVEAAGAQVEVVSAVVPGAAAARSAGDLEAHDAAVAGAVRALVERGDDEETVDAVVLAQASMADAAAGAGGGVPVLTSPASGAAELLRVARSVTGRPSGRG